MLIFHYFIVVISKYFDMYYFGIKSSHHFERNNPEICNIRRFFNTYFISIDIFFFKLISSHLRYIKFSTVVERNVSYTSEVHSPPPSHHHITVRTFDGKISMMTTNTIIFKVIRKISKFSQNRLKRGKNIMRGTST